MNSRTLGFSDLKELTGYQRQADIERCLSQQVIRFFWGRECIWTTVDLVNTAGGLKKGDEMVKPYSPDLI